jgi:hypothetical protein
MIYYTIQTSSNFDQGQVIQKSNDSYSLNDGTGLIIGVVMSCNLIEDTTNYEVMIYAAGGGGTKVKLGANWDGLPTRFDFHNDSVVPTTGEGVGWLIPEYPAITKVAGDLVHGAIYQ